MLSAAIVLDRVCDVSSSDFKLLAWVDPKFCKKAPDETMSIGVWELVDGTASVTFCGDVWPITACDVRVWLIAACDVRVLDVEGVVALVEGITLCDLTTWTRSWEAEWNDSPQVRQLKSVLGVLHSSSRRLRSLRFLFLPIFGSISVKFVNPSVGWQGLVNPFWTSGTSISCAFECIRRKCLLRLCDELY